MDLERLTGALIQPDDAVHTDALRRAAVAVLLSESPDTDIVLTKRSPTLRDHPGQVSLPGGMIEAGEDVVTAALRESEEEVGFDPANATVLGALPGAVSSRGTIDVTAIVATWPGTEVLTAVDLAEVASVHRIPVRDLVDPGARFTAHLPAGYAGPGFTADTLFVWGMTAHVLERLFRLAGWEQPWDRERRRPVPKDVGGW